MTVTNETVTLPNGLTVEAARAEAARTYELDRTHVFHSWSAQAEISPMTITASEGCYVWDGDGNRLLDFSSPAGEHQHRPSAPESRCRHCRAGRQAVHGGAAARQRRPLGGGPADRRAHPRGPRTRSSSPTAAPTPSSTRCGWPGCTPAGTRCWPATASYHGGTETAINLTGDPRRWPNDHGNAGVVHFFGPFLYRSQFHATTEAEETERALDSPGELIRMEGPSTIAAIILESIPGTAGIMVPPPGYIAGVRATVRPSTASSSSPTR